MKKQPTQFLKLFFALCFLINSISFAQTKQEIKVAKLKAKLEAAQAALPHATTVAPQKVALPAPVKGVTVEGITEYMLVNGMKVLLIPDQSQQTITVNITYMVGSRHEGYGETGMAHLLEHMVFKGSVKHTNIPKELNDHGARPNGTTWLDRTNYFETFAANDDNLKWALDLEADRMVNSFIKKEDLESEFSVVRNEFEYGENDPGNVLSDRIVSAAYLWHNYGNSTIGSREDIERVPIDNLKAFYQKYYQPDNAVLIVAGKFDPEKTLALVNEYFAGIPKPIRKLTQTYTKEPAQDTEREVYLKRVGDVQVLGVLYHIAPGTHADFSALDVLNDIIVNEPSGPLYKALVDSKLASNIGGYVFGLKEPGYAYYSVEVPKDKDLQAAKGVFLETLNSATTRDYTNEEVNRAKTQTAKHFDQLIRNSESFAMQLSEFIAKGDWRTFFLFRDGVEKVTPEDVKRVAQKYFRPSNRTVGQFIPVTDPDRVFIPEAPNVEELVKDYKGKKTLSEGEAFDPSPENIEARTIRGTFSNGMEYALLPKTTRGDAVTASMTIRIGDKNTLNGIGMTDNMTASMLIRGTKTLSRQAIKDSLDALKSSVNIGGGGNTVSVNINSTKENLPKVLAIVEDVLKNPVFDANELDNMKNEMKGQIESQLSEPMALAGVQYQRTMNPYPKGDVRYVATFEEQLEMLADVSVDNLKAFHDKLYGTSKATISVVGDFDKDEIQQNLDKRFGQWKNSSDFARIPNEFTVNPATAESIKTPDKANALLLAGINLKMKDTDPDYAALTMGNYLLGGGFLNSRLVDRIRQKDGISYGVGSNVNVSPLDEFGTFTTYAIYAPENAEKLREAFIEEINKVRNEGFTEEELTQAVAGILQGRQVSRAKDNELAGKLNNYLYLDRTMNMDDEFESKLKSLKVEDVNNVFRKYIDPSKITIVQAGDFDKKFAEKKEEESSKPASTGGGNN